jgi:hypothetical protein
MNTLISRIRMALSYELPLEQIHDQIMNGAWLSKGATAPTEQEFYLAYKCAELLEKWGKHDRG